jgi:DNA-binding response OmpR family regulator
MNILLVDNDQEYSDSMAKCLQSAGNEVDTATDVVSVAKSMDKKAYDVCIVDMLKDAPSPRVCRNVISISRACNIPCVVHTSMKTASMKGVLPPDTPLLPKEKNMRLDFVTRLHEILGLVSLRRSK